MNAKEKKQPIDWLLLGQLLVVILVLLTYLALEISSTRSHTGWLGDAPPISASFRCELPSATDEAPVSYIFETDDATAAGEFAALLNSCRLARDTWYFKPLRIMLQPDLRGQKKTYLLFGVTYGDRVPISGTLNPYHTAQLFVDGNYTDVYFAPVWKSTQVEAAFWESFASFAASAMADPRWQVEKPGG